MGYDSELSAAAKVAVAGGFTAKSFIIDTTDTHGATSNMGYRQFNFLIAGLLLPLVEADQASSGATSFASTASLPKFAFDTSLALIGSFVGNSWASGGGPNAVNQRLWVKFVTPIVFDELQVANFHISGSNTNIGGNNAVIQITEDTSDPSSLFEAPVTDGVIIYDSSIREHVPSDIPDFETLSLV